MTPRKLAHDLLQKVEKNDQFLNIALDHALSHSDLSSLDRALASALIYGVTEKRITLDYQISRLSSRPTESLDPAVLSALRLGLYQLIFMDKIPPHAAIYETVSLCAKKTAGFVNAVLRAYTRSVGLTLPEREEGIEEYISVAYSVCLPLTRRLIDIFGTERTESILRSLEGRTETTLATNTQKITRDELLSHIEGASPTKYSDVGIRTHGSVRELYGFDDGLFFVQDEASQLCVLALGAQAGETVMDVCACPGSKSFGAAIGMKNEGKILSFDLHEKKLPLIVSGGKRLGIDIISVAKNDGRKFLPEYEGRIDRVLCDVPCSGFGVLSKKPELRYKDPAISLALPDVQLSILDTASRYIKDGGTLVYSTCTVFPEENEKNIERFLATHKDFSLEPFKAGKLECERGYVTLMPDTHGTDGFFIARLTRKQGT